MRIAYVAQIEADQESGVSKKVVDQISAWRSEGHDARLYLLSRTAGVWAGWGKIGPVVRSYRTYLGALLESRRLADDVLRQEPEVVYFRMGVCYPAFEGLARQVPTIAEVNSDDEHEARLKMGAAKYRLYRWALRRFQARCAGAVCVSRSVGEKLRGQGMDVLVLGNGIEMDRFDALPAPCNAQPRLVFLGSRGCAWHGIEKLTSIAKRFPSWHIDVVGLGRDDTAADFPENVTFHGFLNREAYTRVLGQADAAVGTLALHRIPGMGDTSSLKVREYLALGLPVILGHPDPDFEDGAPFLLQLPNAESNVEDGLDRIRSFVEQWRGRRVARSDVQHLDTRVKERVRLGYLERRASTRGMGA